MCVVFSCVQQLCGCQYLGFVTFAQMLMHAVAHGGCAHTVRESALKADTGRKIPRRTGDLNPRQYCARVSVGRSYEQSYPRFVFSSSLLLLLVLVVVVEVLRGTRGRGRFTPSPPPPPPFFFFFFSFFLLRPPFPFLDVYEVTGISVVYRTRRRTSTIRLRSCVQGELWLF